MKSFAACICLLLAAEIAPAQINYSIIKRQAHTAANGAGSGAAENPPPASPAPPPPQAPPSPQLQATLQNIAALRGDLATLCNSSGTNLLAAQKSSFTNNLAAAAQGTKAKPGSVTKLADDLATAIAGNEKARPHQQKLAQNLHAIFNSAHLTPAQQQAIFDDVQKTLTNCGAPADAVATVAGDLKTIADETK
jgi:hypothetical protein